jgi:hypothetical protein
MDFANDAEVASANAPSRLLSPEFHGARRARVWAQCVDCRPDAPLLRLRSVVQSEYR